MSTHDDLQNVPITNSSSLADMDYQNFRQLCENSGLNVEGLSTFVELKNLMKNDQTVKSAVEIMKTEDSPEKIGIIMSQCPIDTTVKYSHYEGTLLHYASFYGRAQCTAFLLQNGASETEKFKSIFKEYEGKTAIEIAEKDKQIDVIKVLKRELFFPEPKLFEGEISPRKVNSRRVLFPPKKKKILQKAGKNSKKKNL